jgi:hypothetical protein
MTSRLIRRIAIGLIAFYALGQASIAMAACGMDRSAMAQAMIMAACVAHCTADLQLTTATADAVPARAIESRATIPVPSFRSPPVVAYPPPATPPRRILLHSFQI